MHMLNHIIMTMYDTVHMHIYWSHSTLFQCVWVGRPLFWAGDRWDKEWRGPPGGPNKKTICDISWIPIVALRYVYSRQRLLSKMSSWVVNLKYMKCLSCSLVSSHSLYYQFNSLLLLITITVAVLGSNVLLVIIFLLTVMSSVMYY